MTSQLPLAREADCMGASYAGGKTLCIALATGLNPLLLAMED